MKNKKHQRLINRYKHINRQRIAMIMRLNVERHASALVFGTVQKLIQQYYVNTLYFAPLLLSR
jgi:hypothetical protein